MDTITWIEDVVESLDESTFDTLVNRDEAVQIARVEDLGIDNPSQRVDSFIVALPPLFDWFGANYRDFLWRQTRDPWKVIVAEILLQRTHAAKVDEVYRQFFDRFPDVRTVDTADRDQIFETIEPVGMGNRKTRTLKALAEAIVEQHDGTIPNDLDALQDLPRIGPYTARACLCFAYGEPLALVDANIETVVEDVFGYSSSRRAHKDRALYAFLDALIPHDSDLARVFNLSLLDLRVQICDEESSRSSCPLGGACSNAMDTNHEY